MHFNKILAHFKPWIWQKVIFKGLKQPNAAYLLLENPKLSLNRLVFTLYSVTLEQQKQISDLYSFKAFQPSSKGAGWILRIRTKQSNNTVEESLIMFHLGAVTFVFKSKRFKITSSRITKQQTKRRKKSSSKVTAAAGSQRWGDVPWKSIRSLWWLWFSSAISFCLWAYLSLSFLFTTFWICRVGEKCSIASISSFKPTLYPDGVAVSPLKPIMLFRGQNKSWTGGKDTTHSLSHTQEPRFGRRKTEKRWEKSSGFESCSSLGIAVNSVN